MKEKGGRMADITIVTARLRLRPRQAVGGGPPTPLIKQNKLKKRSFQKTIYNLFRNDCCIIMYDYKNNKHMCFV